MRHGGDARPAPSGPKFDHINIALLETGNAFPLEPLGHFDFRRGIADLQSDLFLGLRLLISGRGLDFRSWDTVLVCCLVVVISRRGGNQG